MTRYRMRLVDAEGDVLGTTAPQWLEQYDPNGFGGRGFVSWTTDPLLARTFSSSAAAFTCWQQASTLVPWRPDGRPNRPLTACSVEIEPVP